MATYSARSERRLKQKLQQRSATSEAKDMEPKKQAPVATDPEESGTRVIPEAAQNRTLAVTLQHPPEPPQAPTWYDLEAQPEEGPVGVLEFHSVDDRPALEFQVWLDPDEGEATYICLDENGKLLQIARPVPFFEPKND